MKGNPAWAKEEAAVRFQVELGIIFQKVADNENTGTTLVFLYAFLRVNKECPGADISAKYDPVLIFQEEVAGSVNIFGEGKPAAAIGRRGRRSEQRLFLDWGAW